MYMFLAVGEDYVGEVYNLTFDGSNMATVPVPSIDDSIVEGVEPRGCQVSIHWRAKKTFG